MARLDPRMGRWVALKRTCGEIAAQSGPGRVSSFSWFGSSCGERKKPGSDTLRIDVRIHSPTALTGERCRGSGVDAVFNKSIELDTSDVDRSSAPTPLWAISAKYESLNQSLESCVHLKDRLRFEFEELSAFFCMSREELRSAREVVIESLGDRMCGEGPGPTPHDLQTLEAARCREAIARLDLARFMATLTGRLMEQVRDRCPYSPASPEYRAE